MKVHETKLKGCFIIEPIKYLDERGVFFESFNKARLSKYIKKIPDFVQDNQSLSKKGVIRGLHFQKGKSAQAKLVRVISGSVQDVVVDIRPKSKTFGEAFSIVLSHKNNLQLYIPKGFAHGFLALEDNTTFLYKCYGYYNKESESGIIYNDSELNIKWQKLEVGYHLSQKDLQLPTFSKQFL